MKICNFTQAELDTFRKECNFTDLELHCFELKAKDCTDVQLALKLSISESTAAVTMRRVRAKIMTILDKNTRKEETPACGCGRNCIGIISHTMAEWAKIPDFLSKKGTIYVYADYRTDNDVSVPRLKIGDGMSSISELPFATMAITDEDIEFWDNKPDNEGNDLGTCIEIDSSFTGAERFTFPCDGYLTLEFNKVEVFDDTKTGKGIPMPESPEYAEVNIYGASGKSFFTFSKYARTDYQSKEVFVRKGMKCEFVTASPNATVKFIPLV